MPTGGEHVYGGSGRSGPLWVAASLALAAVLGGALYWIGRGSDPGRVSDLLVHCAAGIRPPVVEAARQYEEEYGVRVRLQYDSSGGLLSGIEVHPSGDLYIPADGLYIERAREKGLVAEAVPLARFRLVIAVPAGNPGDVRSLDDLLRPDVDFALCNDQAGAGRTARTHLQRAGRWEEVRQAVAVLKPTVNDCAAAVETSEKLKAGIVWDSVARQYGLELVEVPELREAVADIHAGRLTASERPAAALRFARYLAAPEKGAPHFEKKGYEPVEGDAWAVRPELKIFCGGVNRDAVRETLAEFERREGCRVTAVYGGCGTLVGQIESSPIAPELFLTCDASYLDMVDELFGSPRDVAQTPIVILVREGVSPPVRGLEDLGRPGLKVGITEPRASALGAFSVELLREVGLWDEVRPNVAVHSPTAHELVLKMETSEQLDAALVYRANCSKLGPGLETVPIEHPRAKARQNMARGRSTRYPRLVGRLMEALRSATSRERFRAQGFTWLADDAGAAAAGAQDGEGAEPDRAAGAGTP